MTEVVGDRQRAVDELLCVVLAAEGQRLMGGVDEQVRERVGVPTASNSDAARATRSRSSRIVDAANALPQAASAIAHSSPDSVASRSASSAIASAASTSITPASSASERIA